MKNTRHFEFWPKRLPKSLDVPQTNVYENLAVSARRYPDKTAIYYYGRAITYRELLHDVDALAGYLQRLGVEQNSRVLLFMQNSPQFMMTYYAVLRANAVVVPLNPMLVTDELEFYVNDCDVQLAIIGQELYEKVAPLKERTSLEHIIVATYADYVSPTFEGLPGELTQPRMSVDDPGVIHWSTAVSAQSPTTPVLTEIDDMAILPYTSGTTGKPKGCVHTHETVQANAVGAAVWNSISSNAVVLTTLPLFHVTGMQHSMNGPLYSGSTIVLMTRWDRDVAAKLVEECGCTHWTNISTMVVDFLSNPKLADYNLSSLSSIGGGGAPLPQAIGEKLFELTGVKYAEGYGLTETISQTHFNPPDRPKLQCMGVPSFDVDARVINPDTLKELGSDEQGEVVVNGPQVFKGYWNREDETEKSFVTIDGKPYFRTGDIAKFDGEGYFFIVDRVKRMINASGFKVWPTEVESTLYKHEAIQQACVIGVPDPRKGETIKAYVILHEKERGNVSEQEIISWAKEHMAAYKYPRMIEFVDKLPVSASGKILWRKLQEQEVAKREKA